VTQPAGAQNALAPVNSIPESAASLESILCTEELQLRPSRPPDHGKENAALEALASALAESRHNILEMTRSCVSPTRTHRGLAYLRRTARPRTMQGNDSIGPPSRACGKSTWGAGRRAISVPRETYWIEIVPCCSGTSSDVGNICCRSRPRRRNAYWFRFTSEAKLSAQYGR
jgi:hypothetical protein